MPVRELIGLSGMFVGGILLLTWAKLRLWEWQAKRPEFKDDDGEA